jgi:hypothetical protein
MELVIRSRHGKICRQKGCGIRAGGGRRGDVQGSDILRKSQGLRFFAFKI